MSNKNIYESMKTSSKIRLNGNESSENINKMKLNEIANCISKLDLNRYPDSDSLNLRKAYSKYCDIPYENIIAGNGSDEMISLVISSYINKGDKVLTLNPDFSMYDYYVSLNDGELIKLDCKDDGSYNVKDLINLGEKEKIKLIIFSNPNNPTGYSIENEDIKEILEAFKDIPVLIDEAYCEFNESTIINEINNYKNLLVTRTLSKAFGAAAIRVGFLIGNIEVINKLSKAKVPYNVNSVSQIIGTKVLENIDRMKENLKTTLKERERLITEFKILTNNNEVKEIKFYKSSGNYIFGRSIYKDILLNLLSNNGIEIRSFKDDTFRITIGSYEENNLILRVIKEFLDEGSCYK